MPPSSLPPEEQGKVKPFDPLVLDRTVIAVPLLKKMQEDFELIEVVKEFHPGEVLEFNAAIELNPEFPEGATAARKKAEAALASYASRVAGTEEESKERSLRRRV